MESPFAANCVTGGGKQDAPGKLDDETFQPRTQG